jgi:two-component system, OmpR family, sensor kinase
MSAPRNAAWRERLRDRVATLPLRTRMLVAMIALLATVCLVVGAISLVLLREYLFHQLDSTLEGAGNRLVAAANRQPPSDGGSQGHSHTKVLDFLKAPGQPPGTLGAWIHDNSVHAGVLDKHGGSSSVDDDDDALRGVPTDGHAHTVWLHGLGEYRLLAVQLPNNRSFVTGLPLDEVNETLTSLAVIELSVAGGGLILAGLASTLVVRMTLRPLSRVAGTAGRVAELRLDRGEVALAERVPVRDTDPRTEVGQVGGALNRMLEHVAGALEARQASETQLRQFLADASHELRTPLAAIRGYAELTRRSAEDSMPPDVAHALRRIGSQAERMTSLVEDMLLLARLDAGRPLVREPVDLSRLVVDGVSDAHAAGPDHRWTLRLPDEEVVITGDATRLAQVLANLLTNARVHTPPGTTVRAELTGTAAEAVLRVVDDGPGIPPGLLPHVFGRFARGDTSRSRAAGSTGLGLAIAHAVVVAHGGQVWVESVPGHTVFTVRLPVRPPLHAEPTSPPPSGALPAGALARRPPSPALPNGTPPTAALPTGAPPNGVPANGALPTGVPANAAEVYDGAARGDGIEWSDAEHHVGEPSGDRSHAAGLDGTEPDAGDRNEAHAYDTGSRDGEADGVDVHDARFDGPQAADEPAHDTHDGELNGSRSHHGALSGGYPPDAAWSHDVPLNGAGSHDVGPEGGRSHGDTSNGAWSQDVPLNGAGSYDAGPDGAASQGVESNGAGYHDGASDGAGYHDGASDGVRSEWHDAAPDGHSWAGPGAGDAPWHDGAPDGRSPDEAAPDGHREYDGAPPDGVISDDHQWGDGARADEAWDRSADVAADPAPVNGRQHGVEPEPDQFASGDRNRDA